MKPQFKTPHFCALSVPLIAVCLAFVPQKASAEPRDIIPLTTWDFAAEPALAAPASTAALPSGAALKLPVDANWKPVTVPHVFRQSGLPDNSAGWYRQRFTLSQDDLNRRIFLRLDGAASVKDVFVNGQFIGEHKSAYTASAFDLTPAIKIGQPNELDVRVGNRDDEAVNILARSYLYQINGGIFRKAWLIKTGAVHIFPDMGSSGVYLTPTNISPARADLGVRTAVQNSLTTPAAVTVRHIVMDSSGKEVARFQTTETVAPGQTSALSATGTITQPQLWDLHQPNLYTVRTELSVGGQITDVVTERTGIRTIVYKSKHFYLNGRDTQLIGVNKHEQSEYNWNAISDDEVRRDWQMMDAMGVNMVRLAHYPHAKLEYDQADEKGIGVWAENGLSGQTWEKKNPNDKLPSPDGERQTREMVRQNWNHPSILFWSAGNETIEDTVSRYAAAIREEDTTRPVTYASPGSANKTPQNLDFMAKNTYDGWYGNGNYTAFGRKNANSIVSETGAGEWVTHHVPYDATRHTVNKFEPAEYAQLFAEYRLQVAVRDDPANHPYLTWWTFREFYDKKFMNNRNAKGLLTNAGAPKDTYYLFQAFLRPDFPVVHLDGRDYFLRQIAADNGIKAYSNSAQLELTLNGVSQGKHANGDYRQPDSQSTAKDGTVTPISGPKINNVFFWKAPLKQGRNVVEVSDGNGHRDSMVIYQKNANEPLSDEPTALVQELHSSNADNQAVFIDRPIEAQAPVYSDVDGSANNTFDILPAPLQGASWIATRRLSDAKLKTDLSFRLNPQSKGATVFVLFSTGTFPTVTVKPRDEAIAKAAASFSKSLSAAGFKNTDVAAVWRNQNLERADAAVWSRTLKAGETLSLPGETLDYVVLVKPQTP